MRLPKRWRGSLRLKLAAAGLIVLLGDVVFWQAKQLAGVQGLFGLGLVAAVAIARPAVRQDRRAQAALAAAAIYAGAQVWDPSLLAFALFWIAIGMATLLPGTARFDDGWRWLQRLLVHGAKSLFGPLIDLFKFSRLRRKRGRGAAGLRRSWPVLVLPVLGTALFIGLFAQANPVVERLLSLLRLPAPDWQIIPRVVLWGVFAMLAWGVLRARPPRRLIGTFGGAGDRVLPGVTLGSVTLSLIAFNAVFLLENLLDAAYLSGLAQLPAGITLADYAHRGAYPLIVTALLAALFVLVTLRPGSGTAASPVVRRLVTLWIIQNLALVASAALRTIAYVEAYSLTVLRISALLWMGLVAAGLVLVLWRMLAGKSAAWLINANLASAGLLLSAVCFVDLGAAAAQWNVRHAREVGGSGAALDLCYLAGLRVSALASAAELDARGLPGALGEQARALHRHLTALAWRERRNGHWSLLLNARLSGSHPQDAPTATNAGLCYG